MKNLKTLVRPLLRKLGRDLIVYDHLHHPAARQAKLLKTYEINMVLDIGANTGQYAKELREIGYRGDIVCFEPLKSAFAELQAWAQGDSRVRTINKAIGDEDGEVEFNVAGNSTSSSILEMLPSHTDAAPYSAVKAKERVVITQLDKLFGEICRPEQNILLKIDTQGYEMPVLLGAEQSLWAIKALRLEMSLVPLYQGQVLFKELLSWLNARNFELVDINPMFIHPETGEVLQVDGFFKRKTA